MTSTAVPQALLRPPPGRKALPEFDHGWRGEDGRLEPYLSYVGGDHVVNWSDDLELLHEESSSTHFIDVWTRAAMLARIGALPRSPVIADLGCSTGYLLEDLQRSDATVQLVGIDLVASGLRKAHAAVPGAFLAQADLCDLPLADESADAIVSANVLEHVPDDRAALAEIRRVLRSGARGVLVVPAGPRTYDYYDRFLGHERRYAHGELSRKAHDAGLEVLEDIHLGSLLYPLFWLVKKRNRIRYDHLRGEQLEARVAHDIERTRDSRLGHRACHLERWLLGRDIALPFGIRNLVVVRRAL